MDPRVDSDMVNVVCSATPNIVVRSREALEKVWCVVLLCDEFALGQEKL